MEWFDEECRFRATDHGRGLIPEPTMRAYLSDLLWLDLEKGGLLWTQRCHL